jgi:glyoxylase-like metal-dependent hydrolase (beta-lactamase superfamily II)
LFFKQLRRHGDNFSYIVADEERKEAAVVDTSYNADEIEKIIKTHALVLKYIINTHGHADHVKGNSELKTVFGFAKIVGYKETKANIDHEVDDGDLLTVGKITINVIHTPGHTSDSICLLVEGKKLLTGDTLFIDECGRTDLPGGNAKSLYDSLFSKLLKLGDEVEIYPGHDYGPKPYSTMQEQKTTNYVLQPRSLRDFVHFMNQP